jgi:hypothetical protein
MGFSKVGWLCVPWGEVGNDMIIDLQWISWPFKFSVSRIACSILMKFIAVRHTACAVRHTENLNAQEIRCMD